MIKDQIEDALKVIYSQLKANGIRDRYVSVHYHPDHDEDKQFVYFVGPFLRFNGFESMKRYVIRQGEKRNEISENK